MTLGHRHPRGKIRPPAWIPFIGGRPAFSSLLKWAPGRAEIQPCPAEGLGKFLAKEGEMAAKCGLIGVAKQRTGEAAWIYADSNATPESILPRIAQAYTMMRTWVAKAKNMARAQLDMDRPGPIAAAIIAQDPQLFQVSTFTPNPPLDIDWLYIVLPTWGWDGRIYWYIEVLRSVPNPVYDPEFWRRNFRMVARLEVQDILKYSPETLAAMVQEKPVQ